MKIKWLFLVISLIGSIYFPFFHYTSIHETGIMKNMVSGKIQLDNPGFHFNVPWILVSKVDTRPQRVCITSVTRTMNCKLARFMPLQYQKLIEREGWKYYWWNNRISFNYGYSDEYRGFRDLIRGYSFSEERNMPFIEIMEAK